MFWQLLAPAALATARRLGTTPSPNESGDFVSELLSVQEISTVASKIDTEEVCLEVRRSLTYRGLGGKHDKLQRGDHECLELAELETSTSSALSHLAVGELVKLRLSHNRVTHNVEKEGRHMKRFSLESSVEVLDVGIKLSRKVKNVQQVTANYTGPIKPEGATMLVATGVNTSTDLQCFTAEYDPNYMTIPESEADMGKGKLHKGEHFCIHLTDQKSLTLAAIRTLAVGQLVTLIVASEMVENEWKHDTDAVETETEWDFKFNLRKGTMNTGETVSQESALVTFEGAKTASPSGDDYVVQFCFKTVETDADNARAVCFWSTTQLVATQAKLLDLLDRQQLRLGWRKSFVSFSGESRPATEENRINSLTMGDKSEVQHLAKQIASGRYLGMRDGHTNPMFVHMGMPESKNVEKDACFLITKSFKYTPFESFAEEIQIGSERCFNLGEQTMDIKQKLEGLLVGSSVMIRWSHDYVQTHGAWSGHWYLTSVGI